MSIEFKKLTKNTLGGVLLHMMLAASIIVLLGILYFYAYLPNITNHGETITVPNIEGKSILEVERFLAQHDLRYEVDSSYSAQYPPLAVLKQYPAAGSKVKENRKIYVSVNRINPPTVLMPNLVDVSVIGAEAILKANELKRGRIELVSWPFPTVKEMKLNGRSLKPNEKIAKGSTIDLVVGDAGSGGGITTPDVMGQSLEDAKFVILGNNLTVEITIVGDTTNGHAIVIKQKPEPGQRSSVGDVVDLWIGKPGADISDEEEDE